MQLAFAKCNGRLLCALKVCDDGDDGGILWSVVEREVELNSIRSLARGAPLDAFLFNELAVNVAWNDLRTRGVLEPLLSWADSAVLGEVDHSGIKSLTSLLLERLHHRVDDGQWLVLEIGSTTGWKPVKSSFITASASPSLIDLFDVDEGNQQEQLGVWLTDNLQPWGVHHSPQIPKGTSTRELTDILLSHEFGAILIESKTLSVLSRGKLPARSKLQQNVSGNIKKAFTQLGGAIRALKANTPVTNQNGDMLSIEREKPAHAIVLIPDLDVVEDRAAYGIAFMRDFMTRTGSFPHLLDISELLRVVQSAELIAAKGTVITPMMAFDYYLTERFRMASDAGTLCIEVLLRIAQDETAAS